MRDPLLLLVQELVSSRYGLLWLADSTSDGAVPNPPAPRFNMRSVSAPGARVSS